MSSWWRDSRSASVSEEVPVDRGVRRLVIHDYSGHPFQIQLSRELARRGHVVHHQHCSSYVSGHGDMRLRPSDPPGLTITGIRLARSFARYRTLLRIAQEMEYACKAFAAIRRARPDVVVLCNVPLLANFLLVLLMAARGVRYVFWHQDVYSEAIKEALNRKLPTIAARPLGALVEALERTVALRAGHVVPITHIFADKYRMWRLPGDRYTVIPNWAEIGHFSGRPTDRGWLQGADLIRSHVVVYSGTLGLKHNPEILLELARRPELDDCSLVVLSEGKGRDWLAERQGVLAEGRLILRDFVPFSELPAVLTSSEVLISILEPGASKYSVPSKVLTYLCAGRPVLAVMDPDNPAARLITDHGAGVVVGSADDSQVAAALRLLLDDPAGRARMGRAARSLAEGLFDIERIADRFESVIQEVWTSHASPST
jgi:colanic acid biosynthesis glycosyl transferase WcaI